MSNNVWFAEKQNGEIIELSELEALTHFESNNISQRMRLKFLGTGDGSKFKEATDKVKALMEERRAEEYPNYMSLNIEEKRLADFRIQDAYKPQIKEILEEGRKAELEQAKINGVKQPDKTLRIITRATGANASRNEILSNMRI